jgi:hypothetical protein
MRQVYFCGQRGKLADEGSYPMQVHREAQSDAFGKTGESVHVLWCVMRALKPDVEASVTQLYKDLAAELSSTSDGVESAEAGRIRSEIDALLDDPDSLDGWLAIAYLTASETDHKQDFNNTLTQFKAGVDQLQAQYPRHSSAGPH